MMMSISENINFRLIAPNNIRRRTCPIISVNNARLTFNSETCRLLNLPDSYEYVELEASDTNTITDKIYLRFRFLEYRTKNSFKLSKERSNRLAISSKALIQEVFKNNLERKTMRLDNIDIDPEKRIILVAV